LRLEIHPESIAVAIRFERCLADLTLAHTDGELLQLKGIVNDLLERRHHAYPVRGSLGLGASREEILETTGLLS
jgi:hypothetical protein